MLSIIYYTDNSLDKPFEKRCQDELIKASEGKPIITVSQKPLDFGNNICLGEIGRSHHSLFLQALTGAKMATTKYVAMAEHDCWYTPEHFNWIPPDDKIFWYNINHWFVQLETGVYTYQRRKPLSQLICDRELFIKAVEEKIEMLETGFEVRKGQPGACEPGVCDNREAFVKAKEKWDKEHGKVDSRYKDVGKEDKWTAKGFATVLPNLDIRHGKNFSGGRRAKNDKKELPYWGNFKEYFKII